MGLRRLKDLISPEHIYQVVAPACPPSSPRCATLDARRNNLPAQMTPSSAAREEMAECAALLRRARRAPADADAGRAAWARRAWRCTWPPT